MKQKNPQSSGIMLLCTQKCCFLQIERPGGLTCTNKPLVHNLVVLGFWVSANEQERKEAAKPQALGQGAANSRRVAHGDLA
jgi:hypothetical protein